MIFNAGEKDESVTDPLKPKEGLNGAPGLDEAPAQRATRDTDEDQGEKRFDDFGAWRGGQAWTQCVPDDGDRAGLSICGAGHR